MSAQRCVSPPVGPNSAQPAAPTHACMPHVGARSSASSLPWSLRRPTGKHARAKHATPYRTLSTKYRRFHAPLLMPAGGCEEEEVLHTLGTGE